MSEKKGALLKIVGIVAGLIGVVVVAGGAAYWAATTAISAGPGGKGEPKPKTAIVDGVSYDAGEFVTNLADAGARRLIRIKLEVVLSDEKARAELDKRKGAMRDAVIGVLRSKTVADFGNDKENQQLRTELQKKIQALVEVGKVLTVFITDFAVQ